MYRFELTVVLSHGQTRDDVKSDIVSYYNDFRTNYNPPPAGQLGPEVDLISGSEDGAKIHKAVIFSGWTPALNPDFVLKGLAVRLREDYAYSNLVIIELESGEERRTRLSHETFMAPHQRR